MKWGIAGTSFVANKTVDQVRQGQGETVVLEDGWTPGTHDVRYRWFSRIGTTRVACFSSLSEPTRSERSWQCTRVASHS